MSKYIYLLKLILLECVIPVGIVDNLYLTPAATGGAGTAYPFGTP